MTWGGSLRPLGTQMEIPYQITTADYRAYYEDMFRSRKKIQRSNFYQNLAWQVLGLLLGLGVSLLHGEIFASCLFSSVLILQLKNNWSFEVLWNRSADEYARTNPEGSGTLSMDAESITDLSQGIRLCVPWSEIHEYQRDDARIILYFPNQRGFILPLRYLESDQLQVLLGAIERNKIQKKS